MKVLRGDVVLADLAFSDQTGSRKRPVLIVSNDINNSAIDDVIVASISSSTRPGALTHVAVDPATQQGKSSGLLYISFVQCENIFTIDKGFIWKVIGHLSSALQQQVDLALKQALDL